MRTVLKFLGKQISGVDYNNDVHDFSITILISFENAVFFEVDVLGAFVGEGCCPIDNSLIVIIDNSMCGGIGDTKVNGAIFDVFTFIAV